MAVGEAVTGSTSQQAPAYTRESREGRPDKTTPGE